MRKLLFVIPEYSHGGTNKSLENLLGLIDKSKYNISICCLYEDGGEYYKRLFAPYVIKKSRLYYWLHDNVVTRKVMGLYNKVTRRDNFGWLYSREVRYIQKRGNYDIAVAYQEGTATMFVSQFQNVKKIAWIHCDYGAWSEGVRRKGDEISYRNINNIVCVSESARKSFITLFPEYQDKSYAIYNLLSVQDIKRLANVNDNKESSVFSIVSIGRLNIVKQFEMIPMIANTIKMTTKTPFRWYIIGSGLSEVAIMSEIKKYGVEDVVMLLGAKDNPYPYMRNADIAVCTSSSESFSYVIAEAKILHTPVLSNDFPVAYEVVDEQTGWIANINDMPKLLARIIDDVDGIYNKKKASISKYEYNNDKIIRQIDELFEN